MNFAGIFTQKSVMGGIAGIILLAVLSRVAPDQVDSLILNR